MAAVVVLLVLLGLRPSPDGRGFQATERVLVISIPGLTWQDLRDTDTPELQSLLGSTALLSTRAEGMEVGLVEAYLTFNSGNTLSPVPASTSGGAPESRCDPALAEAAARGLDPLTGAEVGALGRAIREAGLERRVYGSPSARAALMDDEGCVDVYASSDEMEVGRGVTLLELSGLWPSNTSDLETDRLAVLEALERRVSGLDVPEGTLVMVIAPVGPTLAASVTVVGVRGQAPADATSGGALASATTRRVGYVRTSDLAPTILKALDLSVPTSMAGTAANSYGASRVDERVGDHADLAERVAFRDRAIWPVSVAVVLATLTSLLAGSMRRTNTARWASCLALSLVIWSFVAGLAPYHRIPLWSYAVTLVLVAALTTAVTIRCCLHRRFTSADVLAVALWTTIVLDVVMGGSLQINTPLGYSPTVAGRFQGIGNVAFGLFAAAALATAVVPSRRADGPGRQVGRPMLVLVGVVSVVVTALPRFGSDVGGTLAMIPAFAVAVPLFAGRRPPWRPLVGVAAATVGVVFLIGMIDRSRSDDQQTHLGRFVDRLLDGDAGPILQRKLRSNLELLTGSVWPILLIAALCVLGVASWRHRHRLRPMIASRPAERSFLGGLAVVAVLGFVLNDSGIAVPAMMLAVAVPWVVVALGDQGRPAPEPTSPTGTVLQ